MPSIQHRSRSARTPLSDGVKPVHPKVPPLVDDLPSIICNDRQLRDVTNDSLRGLQQQQRKAQTMFLRGGKVVSVHRDEQGRTMIAEHTGPSMRGVLARVASYYTMTERGLIHCNPPSEVVSDILSLKPEQLDLPRLLGIIDAPGLRLDGSIISKPGYDPETGLYYSPRPGLVVPPIRDEPSSDEVFDAFTLIWGVFGEFPFVDRASGTNFLATLITTVIRSAIEGPVPLALVDAPTPGTGKTLATEGIGLIATGRAPTLFSAPRDEEESRKQITSVQREGYGIVVIDNVGYVLDSAALCKLLTATEWGDRILGHSRTISLPVRAVWIANGNNIKLGGDLPRRCYWIRLDAKTSKPWERGGFSIPNLKAHILQHRGELLAAVLTLARAWYAAGSPSPRIKPIGSFESWTMVIGGILEYAGIAGFLENADTQVDEESIQWEGFLLAIRRSFGSNPFTTADLWRHCADSNSQIHQALPDFEAEYSEREGSFQRRMGQSLRARIGRLYGKSQVFVERAGTEHGAARWKIKLGT